MAHKMLRRIAAALCFVLWLVLFARPVHGQSEPFAIIGADQVAALYPWLDGVSESGLAQRVAVLDTGVQFDHGAFNARVVAGVNYAADAAWASTDPAAYTDRNGHGTFVAGVIGSASPAVPGLAPGVEFISVRIADTAGASSLTNLLMGLQWVNANAAEYNITAVNVSLGTDEVFARASDVPASPLYNAISDEFTQLAARDIVSVVSSGNSGSTTGLSMPAITDNVVSVGASTQTDTVAPMTNRNDQLELLAPGVGITSLWKNNGLMTASGTSFATPFVTAAAVLIRDALQTAGLDLHNNHDNYQTYLVDLLTATADRIDDPAAGLAIPRLNLLAAVGSILTGSEGSLPGAEFVPEPAALPLMLTLLLFARRPRRPRSAA